MAAFVFIAGCEKKEEAVRTYDAPKDPQLVSYAVPAGWQTAQINPKLQHAGWTAGPDEKRVSITVSYLFNDAPAARDLAMNVNRWRNQLGLAPLPPAEIPSLVKTADAGGTSLQVVDLVNEDATKRTYAYIAPRADRVWFYKMTGAPEAVDAAKPKFDAFVKSAKYLSPAEAPLTVASAESAMPGLPPSHPPVNSTPQPIPAPAAAAANGNAAGLTYTLPAGWTVQPNPRPMRILTIQTAGNPPAEVIVSRFPGNVGGTAMNLARWRGEVGLPPTDDANANQEKPIKVGTADGQLLEFVGPAGEGAKMSLVAKRTVGDNTWFFKILGPAQSVTTQRGAFEQFLASVRFADEVK